MRLRAENKSKLFNRVIKFHNFSGACLFIIRQYLMRFKNNKFHRRNKKKQISCSVMAS